MPRTKKDLETLFDEIEDITLNFDDEETAPKPKIARRKPSAPKSIMEAMDKVLTSLQKSELRDASMRNARPALDYLGQRLGLTDMQNIFLSMLCDAGRTLDYAQMCSFLGCHRLRLISYDSELQELVRKGILNRIPCERGEDDYIVRKDAMDAYSKNEVYERPPIENLSFEDFLLNLRYLMNKKDHQNITYGDFIDNIKELLSANQHLHFVREVKKLELEEEDLVMLLLCVHGLVEYNEAVCENNIGNFLRPGPHSRHLINILKRNQGPLFELHLIEQTCDEGFMTGREYSLTEATKANLLQGYELEPSQFVDPRKGLIHHEDIKVKELFYNEAEKKQIERLTALLQEENFKGIQERLEQKGYRKGFATLFYGAPGVGKTETVLQLARQTGRDIYQVNIAGLRDKFVGESEKNIKAVFNRYRNYCKTCERIPILLFNEADAIISKRTENVEQAVDQMNNSIQNIILQEMETLDGILIATTNLTTNLDDAFDRRFLFSVDFKKPSTEVKAKIWQSMICDLTEKDALALSKEYNFSGGEIENISRKLTVDSILYGSTTSLKLLREYCDSEAINKKRKNERSPISGFSRCA